LLAGDTLLQAIHYVVYRLPAVAVIVLLDKDESCPTADLSNIGCPNGMAYSVSELLNTPQAEDYQNCFVVYCVPHL